MRLATSEFKAYNYSNNLCVSVGHEALAFLLDHLPPQVNLIITTRVDPPLPLSRLRGRGQLIELGVTDLRFTSAEVTTFLNEVMGLPLTAQNMAALEERTEGWIAGLQLAALAMRDQTNLSGFVSAFTGSNRFVVDYLVTEVLARQPAHVQTFLLQTAILERVCGPLCDVVMGIAEVAQPPSSPISPAAGQPALAAHSYSQMLLEALERAHLFLLPLDNDRRWYRYHHLFAEVLRGRLVSGATAEMVAALHRRAAAWYEDNGLLVEAIQHALAAADFAQAARLIEQVALALPVMIPSQVHTLLGWLKALPEPLLQTSPALCVVHASVLLFINQMEAAEARLQAAERAVQRQPRSDRAHIILGQAAAVRGALVRFSGDLARCAALSHQALDLLPETEYMWLVARLNAAYAFLVNGEVTPASERHLAEVIELIRPTHNSYILLRGMTLLARLQALQGRLKQAAATYQEAAQIAPEQLGVQVVLNSSIYYFGLGDLLREWNELEAAEHHLKQGLDMLNGAMAIEAEVATLGYMALARLKQAQGDRDGALATLRALAELAQQRHFFPPLIERGRAIQARLQLMQGDLEAARRWVEQRGLTADDSVSGSYLHEMEYLTLVRVLIALGKHEGRELRTEDSVILSSSLIVHPLKDALRVLDRSLPVAEANGRTSSIIEILSLRALALQAQGNLTEALAALERALIQAESEGYVRIFVDEGKPLAKLLSRLNASFDGGTSQGQVLKEYVHKLLGSFGMSVGVQVTSPNPLLAEPLSDRELEVLRLLAAGLTNQEIAYQLLIALGTAKRHTINIYGKLGVSNRTQAVAKARELNLL